MLRRTTRPTFVPLVLAYARAEGLDVDALLRRCGLSPEIETQAEVEVELERVDALNNAIASALDDPFLGIHVAVRYRRGAYQLVEFTCRNSHDMRGAAMRLVRYAKFVNPAATFSFTEAGGRAALSERFDGLGRHASEFAIALIYLVTRELTRVAWTPEAVWFAHEAPSDTSELVSLFGTERIRFGQDSNGLFIGRNVLDAPISSADAALLEVLEGEMARHAPSKATPTLSQIVLDTQRAVTVTLELGAPRLEKIAESLGTSARTLQRRLDEEGTSFQKVVEQTRERLARHHVERGELSTAQMAFLLGYADVTAFLRGFKRWTGTTPQAFRGGKRATRNVKKGGR